ncbi:hypothetical protein EN962_16220 [Mesorhizobium sp. M7A.F.Ca.CA.001.09.2.1]|uniref:Uncharacterized protein n=1 Tax=Mesorhizobium ciceri biovar biserrulae (strain HAMBI 2942 / LMG 23838 / WSM1271) TaxID=765698 RepID=E8TCN6_MESCW|nr:hypothetical protein Mesci_1723 [Mesorhizobium ciceri biovar biserrulae WSM1271]ARP63500.1 hypothetical protein A9K65_009035 [Mesorhizobium sp. WSM1497]RUU19017.1 hypothetical protein EOC84_18660 [Mesorhizobium sp. Primo-B]RUU35108.1 hypothetical protein EOC83_27020 [Mesorhizobium sp. Primo-A]RUX17338.1 hypothetical protein EN996_05750 [Mesorhizobium sp. M7A.F.Ca.CA.002.14.1.2]RUX39724.1 hypothetical protein EN987_11055 [Mesorhizobium sp. M7A.F.Ca.CA.002.11.2.1]RUX54057.1 hypothetical prot
MLWFKMEDVVRKVSITSSLMALVGLGAITLAAFPAQADNLQLQLGKHGPRLKLMEDCDPAYDDCEGPRRDDRRDRRQRGCTEDRALDKADRMGIRRARIESVGRREITVRGRQGGDRVRVTFGTERGCPILDRE